MSELAVANSPVAKLFFGDDFISNVYPNKVADSIDQAEPFFYQVKPEIRVQNNQIFKPETQTLSFDIAFPRPPQSDAFSAKQEIKAFFDEPDRNLVDIVLYPLDIISYELWLDLPGITNYQISLGKPEDGPYGSTSIRIREQIVDEQIIVFLTQSPENITVIFRPFYLFEATNTSSVFMEFTGKACSRAFENVFGRNPDSTYLVNRKVLQALQEDYKNEIRMEFRNYNSNNLLHEKACNEIFDLFNSLEPITAEELLESRENMIIFGLRDSKLEIKPIAFENMANSLESFDKLTKSCEETWDKVEEFATTSSSAESFFNDLKRIFSGEQNANGRGDVGVLFGFLDIGQTLNFDSCFEGDFSELSQGEKSVFESARNKMMNASSGKSEYLRESYIHWQGEDYESGSIARPLQIFRVSQAYLSNNLRATATFFEETGEEVLIGPELQFSLFEEESSTIGHRTADMLRLRRRQLINEACAKVWERYQQEIELAVFAHSGQPRSLVARRRALIRFTTQFQAVLWEGIQQVILSCRSGRRLNIPQCMPRIGYCEHSWFRQAFVFIKNHHGLVREEADIANAYFNQLITAFN